MVSNLYAKLCFHGNRLYLGGVVEGNSKKENKREKIIKKPTFYITKSEKNKRDDRVLAS